MKIEKLGLGIVAFDDVCHLKNITSELRDLVDNITICLQKTSYHGDPIEQKVIDHINVLKDDGLVNDIIWFEAKDLHEDDPKNAPRLKETDKRNFIIDFLEKDRQCSHVLIIDSDEFYDHDDFAQAKQIINDKENAHVTYCQYFNYYRDYRHVMLWPFLSYVPFITESSYRFNFYKPSFDKPSDPTRRYHIDGENPEYCLLGFGVVKMHHLSWIRTNIEDKIKNWSSITLFDNVEELKKEIIERYNNYKDGQNAIIMFNTPGNRVVVEKFPAQYINPKYPLTEI